MHIDDKESRRPPRQVKIFCKNIKKNGGIDGKLEILFMSTTRDVNRRSCSQSHCAMIRQRAEIFKMKTNELLNQPKENNFNAKNKLRYIFEFFQR